MTVMKCMHVDCLNEAVRAPKLMVPATDWPIEAHQPLGLTLGVVLCLNHLGEVNAQEVLEKNPAINSIIVKMCEGKVPPDFARAYIQPLALDSEEFKMLMAQNKKRNYPEPGASPAPDVGK